MLPAHAGVIRHIIRAQSICSQGERTALLCIVYRHMSEHWVGTQQYMTQSGFLTGHRVRSTVSCSRCSAIRKTYPSSLGSSSRLEPRDSPTHAFSNVQQSSQTPASQQALESNMSIQFNNARVIRPPFRSVDNCQPPPHRLLGAIQCHQARAIRHFQLSTSLRQGRRPAAGSV